MPDMPTPVSNPHPPLVEAADEARHEPGPEPLWSESWYADVADPVLGLGAYLRFGLYPNRDQTWFQLTVVGEGRPLVSLRDEQAPLATGDGQQLTTDTWECRITSEVPLERWRVQASGTAETLVDPTAVYRSEAGVPTPVSVDLTWQSVAPPYHYGVSTRYEISANVTGTITVGDEVLIIDAPGQRDHSWAVRDWWAFEWCWSAGVLDDGTRFHLTEVRLPNSPVGFGYVVSPQGELVPATSIAANEVLHDAGLPRSATLGVEPGGLVLDAEPVAFSPLLFTSDDGQVARFPRALCRYHSADGRAGVGWTEWNQIQR